MAGGGKQPGAGRPPGKPNKLTAEIKELIEGALHAVGGQSYLIGVAETNPAVFCALLGRIIPTDVRITKKTALDDMTLDDIRALTDAITGRLARHSGPVIEGNCLPEAGSLPALPETKDIP